MLLSVLSAFFLVVCTDFSNAQVTPAYADWHLTVTGLVEHPLNLNLTEITAMPSTSEYAVLYCVDYPNIPVTQGNWTGVKLSYLLKLAGADNTAKVAFYASDDYSTDLSMQQAMQDYVILAYQLDDAQLSETLRLVVPGHWGYKWISQVTTIELVGYDYLGRWESRGYSDEASITSNSGISTGPGSPFRDFPQSQYSPAVSPPPSTIPPESTSAPTLSPSASPPPTPIPTVSPITSTSPEPSPSPISTKLPEADSSSGETPDTSIAPYVIVIGVCVTAAVTVALAITLWKRRR